MSEAKRFNIEIPETKTEEFFWQIEITDGLSRLKDHEKEVKKLEIRNDKYSKSEQTFDTGILEDVPNYGSFNVTWEKISYSLELVESIDAQTVVSVKNCQVNLDYYYKDTYSYEKVENVSEYHAAVISGGFNPVLSERQQVTDDPDEILKFMRWSGEYKIPQNSTNNDRYVAGVNRYGKVNRIKISWKVQRVTDGKMIDKSCPNNNDIVTLAVPNKQLKLWNASSGFFGSKNLSDVTFVCDGKEFPSHRFVLSAKSPVFCQMLHSDSEMKEAKEGRIVIVDIKPEILKEFLRFLYCGTVKKLGSVSKELFIVADKYDVELLKKSCEKSLVDQVTKKNAVEMYCLAEPRAAKTLMEQALTTMKTNRTKIFRNSKYLLEFTQRYPDVMLKIVNFQNKK